MQKLILEYSQKYKIGTERILELIEQLSGNFSDLQEVIENKKENILWTADDDLKLSSSKNKNDKNYKTLLSNKGQERIKERCLFKSILLPFWNWLTIYNLIYNNTIYISNAFPTPKYNHQILTPDFKNNPSPMPQLSPPL